MTNLSGTNLNNGAAVGPQGEGRDSPSTFPKYPAYKDSGVEWLGAVPEGWKVSGIKFFADLITGITPPSDDLDNYAEEGWPWVRPEDLNDSGKPVLASKFLTDQGWRFCRKVKRGSTLICCIGTIGKIGFVDSDVCTNQQITAVVPRGNGRFFFYAMQALKPAFDVSATGNVLRILNSERLGNVTMAVPDHSEAESIALFLDHETARIDALIEEQQRLIELLKEKRQAVISHAVTKGLDPTVPMKDSGVEWLGEVPAHWDVVAIKWLSPVLRGASPRPIDDPKYFDDSGEYAWVRIADVSASDGTLRETTQTLSALGASLSVKMEPGEMFLSIAGTVGKPCITQIKACIHDGFVYFPSLSIDNKFLYRIFEVGTCYGGLGKMGTQLNLNTETVGGIQIGVPPDSEIAQILEFIDRQSSVFDSLVGEAAKGVELLQERRSALISAAVTGKIDVRGWEPPASIQAPAPAVAEAV